MGGVEIERVSHRINLAKPFLIKIKVSPGQMGFLAATSSSSLLLAEISPTIFAVQRTFPPLNSYCPLLIYFRFSISRSTAAPTLHTYKASKLSGNTQSLHSKPLQLQPSQRGKVRIFLSNAGSTPLWMQIGRLL